MTHPDDVARSDDYRRTPGRGIGKHMPPACKPSADLGTLQRILESLKNWDGEMVRGGKDES